jgi:hypothetical protein
MPHLGNRRANTGNGAPSDRCRKPLNLFAAHRFLITLIYWKAPEVGSLEALRESLRKGKVPQAALEESK